MGGWFFQAVGKNLPAFCLSTLFLSPRPVTAARTTSLGRTVLDVPDNTPADAMTTRGLHEPLALSSGLPSSSLRRTATGDPRDVQGEKMSFRR